MRARIDSLLSIMPEDLQTLLTSEELTSEDLLARVLHRDGLMLVLNKPAGIPVHRGPKGGDNLEAHFDVLRFGLPKPPALAHRLDKDTSGCLVLGRHHKATQALGKLFKDGLVSKTYWAIVEDGPDGDAGLIDLALGRLDAKRGWWMKVDPFGQPSQTRWTVLGRGMFEGNPIAWMALEPLTGRTHQLRVHSSSMGWAIVGDQIYGAYGPGEGPGLQLHARTITIPMQKNKEPVRICAPAPDHILERLKACGFKGEDQAA
jgi:tRNA pseudouridine32 synthase/23S rRNA pseudouridine746 synthase